MQMVSGLYLTAYTVCQQNNTLNIEHNRTTFIVGKEAGQRKINFENVLESTEEENNLWTK